MAMVHDTGGGVRRPMVGLLAVVLAAGVGLFVSGSVSDAGVVLEVPAQDHVVPRVLADGTPVFVLAGDPGRATVIEALTPTNSVIGGTVGWCAAGRRFVDPQLGLSYDADGQRINGRVPGRTSRSFDTTIGLTPRDAEAGGDAGTGAPLRVGDATNASVESVDAPLGGERGHAPPQGCRAPSRRIGDNPANDSLAGVVDHGSLAASLRPALDGWQIATGWIQVGPEGTVRWCDGVLHDRTASACNASGGVAVDLSFSSSAPGGVITVIGDPLAVRVRDGRITQVAVLPRSTWAGSSLMGTLTHRLVFIGMDQSGTRLLVIDDGSHQCVSVAPQNVTAPLGASVMYVDIDTHVDVRGATDLAALAELEPTVPDGEMVEAVLDRVTCRVLSVRDVR